MERKARARSLTKECSVCWRGGPQRELGFGQRNKEPSLRTLKDDWQSPLSQGAGIHFPCEMGCHCRPAWL